MGQPNIKSIEEQIAQLEQQKAKLEQLKRELPTIARIHTFTKSSAKIKIKLSKFDDKAVDVLRRVPSRVWTGDDNTIAVMDLDNTIKSLKANGVKVFIPIRLLIEIKKYLNQPDLSLEI